MNINVGDIVVVTKGNAARKLRSGTFVTVTGIEMLGRDYSHSVRISIAFQGRRQAWYARHINRLNDPVVRLNDGNPLHVICLRKRF